MSWSDVRAWVFILGLCFLFAGEPDVWDHLHDMAMGKQECAR